MTPEHDPAFTRRGQTLTAQEEQAALRHERDLFSAVLDSAGALVILLDPQGRIVRFNRACETTTGYSFDEVRGQVLWDLLVPADEIEPVRAVFAHLRAGHPPLPSARMRSTRSAALRSWLQSRSTMHGSTAPLSSNWPSYKWRSGR